MTKTVFCVILLCVATTALSEVHYIIVPSQLPSYEERYSNVACVDNDLTLSQFVQNSSNYLTNETRLTLSPGNYKLELKLIVENIHSFSMLAWPASASKKGCNHLWYQCRV